MNNVFEFRTQGVRYNYTQLVVFLLLGDPPPGNRPKERIQHLEHCRILRSNILNLHTLCFTKIHELLYFLFLQGSVLTRLRSGNACYHLVQNILSFRLLGCYPKI